jgi:biopolymer transport protein ExbB
MPRFPALRVIGRSIEAAESSKDVLEAALEEAILKEIPPMERFLATLNILAAIAPLLGLLGTVTGMISTFQVITLYGTGDPRMMSGGISEALITTQLGLAVAIPIMVVHHFLQRRVETLLSDMEEKGTAFAAAILDGKQRK